MFHLNCISNVRLYLGAIFDYSVRPTPQYVQCVVRPPLILIAVAEQTLYKPIHLIRCFLCVATASAMRCGRHQHTNTPPSNNINFVNSRSMEQLHSCCCGRRPNRRQWKQYANKCHLACEMGASSVFETVQTVQVRSPGSAIVAYITITVPVRHNRPTYHSEYDRNVGRIYAMSHTRAKGQTQRPRRLFFIPRCRRRNEIRSG